MTDQGQTRTTVYLTKRDRERLARLKKEYGLGISAAVRVGLTLLERALEDGRIDTDEDM